MDGVELALLHNTFELDTERLQLVAPGPEHAEALFELVGGADRTAITSTLLWGGPDTVSEMEEWIDRNALPYGEHGFHWVIVDREGLISGTVGSVLGVVSTRPIGPEGRADVGYYVGKQYWNLGIMTEALRAVISLGIETLGHEKIEASVFVNNPASARVLEKLGFEKEGLVRRYFRKKGAWVDAYLYGLVVDATPS